ncbi:MAG: energy-coupling factor transporter ATPase [Armatimonadetes bacterium]|nr:energy-coupling factor transporter ATPase [Armatimonadota bacterium]
MLEGEPLIEVEGLGFTYMKGTPFENQALRDVDLRVEEGEGVGLAGTTGSGKSTLIQHFNGLLRPQQGTVRVLGRPIPARGGDLRWLRATVGLLFQFPEQQLFEETVFADVGFGPRSLGLSSQEVKERVEEALERVGLDGKTFGDRSPFQLSGGEKRKAALAGVLANRPRCLVLDEPTAGLDPVSRRELIERLRSWRKAEGLTLIVVSHSMEELALLTDRLVVLADGRVAADGPIRELFHDSGRLAELGLEPPAVRRIADRARERGVPFQGEPITMEEADLQWAEFLGATPPASSASAPA